ncbi:hypothetical protein A6769_06090 [Nostoc punctiforme NIES-2108]|uniref:Uncharacterized protein n=1 Tax=Nostoc punctiforme NIES-2108 TaxID=1356359 RepID=A0A367RTN4_NOSPU|nr:hypothetical protein A6769_06090 [Nostoc punctiforme NIES-2108]
MLVELQRCNFEDKRRNFEPQKVIVEPQKVNVEDKRRNFELQKVNLEYQRLIFALTFILKLDVRLNILTSLQTSLLKGERL